MVENINWQWVNLIISALAAFMSFGLATYAWTRRRVHGAVWFSALCLGGGWVAFWYIFEATAGENLDAYVTFSKFEYIALTFIPLLWLGFALTFRGQERALQPSILGLLSIVPVLTIIFAFTNDFHGLIWKVPRFDTTYSQPIYVPDYGAWFWVYILYSYLIFLVGSVILVRQAFTMMSVYRAQATLIFVGTVLPWVSNLLGIFDNINPVPFLYLNAIFLSVANLCFAFALFRLRLLDMVPLAYETILNNVPDGIIVVDLHDRIVMINQFIRPYLDIQDEDPIGKPLVNVFSRYRKEVEILQSQNTGQLQRTIDDFVVEIRVSPVYDRVGKARGRLFVMSDVTARTKIEQAEREERLFSETMREIGGQLNSTLDTHRILALIIDSIGQLVAYTRANIMLVNPQNDHIQVAQQRGYSPTASAALKDWDFDYRQFASFKRAESSPEPLIIGDVQQEVGWTHIDGIEDTSSLLCAPIRVDGQLVGFINLDHEARDAFKPEVAHRLQIFANQAAVAIKNARLYEQTRQQAEERQRRVESLTITQQVYREIVFSFNPRTLMEITLDAVLRISLAEAAYLALMREDKLELIQRYGKYPVDSLQQVLNMQEGIIGQSLKSKHPIKLTDDEPLISALKGTQAQIALPLITHETQEQEAIAGIIVLETSHPERFTEDRFQMLGLIADRLAVALENIRLVEAVRARAAELEALYHRVSGLEELKSNMIRIAAHDLKNPLSVLLGYLELLTGDYPIANPATIHKTMLGAAKRMLQIIGDFLSLERIEKVAQEQTKRAFDLRETALKAVDEYLPRATQKSQTLQCSVIDEPSVVFGDDVLLFEALTNLIGNALKYTDDGGSIKVRLDHDDGQVRIEVEDTGFGIPADKQAQLFQPFSRIKTEQTKNIEGTGLGLHLTKNIIESQGGTLIFQSEVGKGSVFGFRIPLFKPSPASAATN